MLDMGRAMGCRVIAEGVETERECRELVDLGLDRLQGHLFGRPGAAPMAVLQQLESLDRSIVTQTALCAEHIAVYVRPVAPDTRVTEVADMFRDQPDTLTLAVVQDGRPLGVVRRDELFSSAREAAASGDLQQEARERGDGAPTLMIDGQLRLEQVSRLVTQKRAGRA